MDASSSSPRAHTAFSYRPGLDGVRALAVLAVILYHGKVSWAHGGFLGVDVFFVLSGFLITSLLISERDRGGRIDLVGFWTRRARRLLPALFLVLVGVAVYAVVWAQPTELSKLRSDGLATLLYASNWKFIFEGTSYFQAFQTPSPLAHTWSLAIEEQWYLLWPLALPLVLRMCRGRRKVTAAFIGTCAIGSAALMAVLFHAGADPSRVYYGTDTRAQALLIGAVLALLTAGRQPALSLDTPNRPVLVQLLGVTGAVVIAVLVARANATGAFLYRGGFALAALAAAAFVAAAATDGPVSRALSIRPLAAIGAISYGLYLWHWPVDVVVNESRTGLAGAGLFATQLGITFAIATASFFVVERPIRRNGLAAFRVPAGSVVRRALVPVAAVGLAVVLFATTMGAEPAPTLAAIEKAQAIAQPRPRPGSSRVLMLGDSQLLTLAFHSNKLYSSPDPRIKFDPILGCGALDAGMQPRNACMARPLVWQHDIQTYNPDLTVVMIGAWETLDFTVDGRVYVHGTPEHERALVDIVSRSIVPLLARGGQVALMEVPCFGDEDDSDSGARDRAEPQSIANVNDALREIAALRAPNVTFIPWAGVLCPDGRYRAEINGIRVRPDGVHYESREGVKLVEDRLLPAFRGLARRAHMRRANAQRS
jgi:peptidoglycan/LPS O-acetylase OafA/YrhL